MIDDMKALAGACDKAGSYYRVRWSHVNTGMNAKHSVTYSASTLRRSVKAA